MVKIFELTTNEEDGYRKYYVVGVNSDAEGKALAKKGFGKFYWDAGGAIGHYDDVADAKKRDYYKGKYWMTKSEFMKQTKIYREREF